MNDPRISRRVYLAKRILATCADPGSGRDVLSEVHGEDFDAPVLEELLDLFEHQPAKSRLWGLTGRAYDEYVARMRALAAAVVADPCTVPHLGAD